MTSKVNLLLAFAYDTRDIHIGELFVLQRLHRRTIHALELQKAALGDMRERISTDCSQLDEVKETLRKRGFVDMVNDFANARECPAGNIPPADIAFVYKYNGTRLPTFRKADLINESDQILCVSLATTVLIINHVLIAPLPPNCLVA